MLESRIKIFLIIAWIVLERST